MAKDYSRSLLEKMNATSADEVPLLLLEITHLDLSQPIRVVNDNQNLESNGDLFVAMAFRAALPDDMENQMPRAQLAVDNIGRELTDWLDQSGGGEGAQVRMMQVLRSAPDVIEWEVTLDLSNVRMNMLEVTGELGFEDLLNKPGIPMTYRPDTAPGLY